MNNVTFKEWNCILVVNKYANNGNTYLQLTDKEDGLPVAICTVNIEKLPANEVYIKNYGENEGMVDCLLRHGIIGEKISEKAVGFALVGKYKLL